MKTYTFCTRSHQHLLDDWLKRTLPSDLELVCSSGDQECPTGNFMTDGWNQTMLKKVELILQAVEETWGNAFFFVDADIQFFGPVSHVLRENLKRSDIVAQEDSPLWKKSDTTLCAGMFACRSNDAVRSFWRSVLELMRDESGTNDQVAMNRIRRSSEIRMAPLPPDLFWSPREFWEPGALLKPPQRILAHHANFTVGVDAKFAQLTAIRQIVDGRNGVEYHGTNYGGYYVRSPLLSSHSIVYSVGVGEDASFDRSLIEKFGLRVYAFDPTPKSIDWVKRENGVADRFNFSPCGILDRNETVEHYEPANPDHVSCSSYPISERVVHLPMRRLVDVMHENGHTSIDLLKLDIEGSECDVIDDMLNNGIHPKQLLVEFHPQWLDSKRIQESIMKLRKVGYRRFAKHRNDLCFSL